MITSTLLVLIGIGLPAVKTLWQICFCLARVSLSWLPPIAWIGAAAVLILWAGALRMAWRPG